MTDFTGTFFFHKFSRHKKEFTLSPGDLVDLIETHHKERKEDLQWIKLALFGDHRTGKEALRNNQNVLSITGVEADYDGKKIAGVGFDEAVRTVERFGIEAIVYTTPSHQEDKPRWRILAPLSKELPPTARAKMLARINGIFNGAIDPESFVLSQSYYIGYVGNGASAPPSHRAVYVQGKFIDTLETLDAGAIGEHGAGNKKRPGSEKEDTGERFDFKGAVAEIVAGGAFHVPMVKIAASMDGKGYGWPEIEAYLYTLRDAAMEKRPDLKGRDDIARVRDWFDERRNPNTPPQNAPATGGTRPITRDDFYAILSQNLLVFTPTREFCTASAVDKSIRKGTSVWVFRNRRVEQVTWAPGHPQIITDLVLAEGGFIPDPGNRILNTYRGAVKGNGNPDKAAPWLNHIKRIYQDDLTHIVHWLAHRVQFPAIKINHALVLGGGMGIGKDTLLEPVKRAIGHWNFIEVSPQHMLGRFNGFTKSVILRVSEARDLGDSDRFKFYDHMKALIAAPPDTLLVDEKHLKPYSIPNLTGIIITTNHKADGIFLPPDDRRHYVAWSQATESGFEPGYWNELWGWYENGGFDHVSAYLHSFDLEGFDPKAPPPKTRAFWDIANASRAPEDGELADVIDKLGEPNALILNDLVGQSQGEFLAWITDRKNRRAIPHRLEKAGYVPVHSDRQDGQWLIKFSNSFGGSFTERKTVYAKNTLTIQDQVTAALHLSTTTRR